jgi:lipoprotein-anchoring transpeptidase ErfK/SrfK
MGVADSHGCIRLRDDDLLRLFDEATPGTPVWLHD